MTGTDKCSVEGLFCESSDRPSLIRLLSECGAHSCAGERKRRRAKRWKEQRKKSGVPHREGGTKRSNNLSVSITLVQSKIGLDQLSASRVAQTFAVSGCEIASSSSPRKLDN